MNMVRIAANIGAISGVIIAGGLAGCSSSSTSATLVNDVRPAHVAGALRDAGVHYDASGNFTAPTATETVFLPASASYSGGMVSALDKDTIYYNRMELDANFSAGTVSGRASNFTEVELTEGKTDRSDFRIGDVDIIRQFDGTLVMQNARITGNNIFANMDGRLNDAADSTRYVVIDAEFSGYAVDHEATADRLWAQMRGTVADETGHSEGFVNTGSLVQE